MKCLLNIIKYIVGMCILSNTSLLTYASSSCREHHHECCCKEGPRGKRGHNGHGKTGPEGPQGPQGPQGIPGTNGTSFVITYGGWFDGGSFTATLLPGSIVPFASVELANGITELDTNSGIFQISKTGVYFVTYGIAPAAVSPTVSFIFSLERNGIPIPGGYVSTAIGGQPSLPLSTTSVLFSAIAGDQITLTYINSLNSAGTFTNENVVIGPVPPTNNPAESAYIIFLQIQ